MIMETKQKKTILVIFLFLCYFLLLAPYIVHTNLNEVGTGVVNDVRILPVQSLPKDVQDVVFTEECTVLLLEDSISGIKTVVIIERSLHSSYIYKGDVIEITDKIIEWYVDWHAYQFFNEKFDILIVGDVEQLDSIEAFIEEILYSRLGDSIRVGSLIFALSQVIFCLAPLILIFYTSFLFRKRFCLWNIIAILALYSLEVFIFNMVGGMHDIIISDAQKYFGYLYLVLVPLTFFLSKYEESGKIKVFYEKIAELIARLFR